MDYSVTPWGLFRYLLFLLSVLDEISEVSLPCPTEANDDAGLCFLFLSPSPLLRASKQSFTCYSRGMTLCASNTPLHIECQCYLA
jgi:hypothetical protein